jgi:hypothetical protein
VWNVLQDFSVNEVFTVLDNNLVELRENHNFSAESFFYMLPLSTLEDFSKAYPGDSSELLRYLDLQENNK